MNNKKGTNNKKKDNNKKESIKKAKVVDNIELSFKAKFITIFKQNWKKFLIVIVLILSLWLIITRLTKKGSSAKYVLDEIYSVYPEEVTELYQNILDVSCNGDLNFDISISGPPTLIKDVNSNILATYVISYLDKNDLYEDGMNYSQFVDAEKRLFNTDSDLLSKVASFQYGDYRYMHMGDKIIRQENACVKGDYEDFMHLYSYSYNKNYLSVYVAYGRVKDGIIYNDSGVRLSNYNDSVNLDDAMIEASYYVFKFIKDDSKYKLHSIQHLSKA